MLHPGDHMLLVLSGAAAEQSARMSQMIELTRV
jgi:hypothetical protein